jgi:hypothetical protein
VLLLKRAASATIAAVPTRRLALGALVAFRTMASEVVGVAAGMTHSTGGEEGIRLSHVRLSVERRRDSTLVGDMLGGSPLLLVVELAIEPLSAVTNVAVQKFPLGEVAVRLRLLLERDFLERGAQSLLERAERVLVVLRIVTRTTS